MGEGPEDAVNVQCYGNKSVVVRVIDICPCFYAPKGKEPYYQYDCCYKSQNHIKSGQVSCALLPNLPCPWWC
jgi:cullin-associated NEDD8-dissociated protein 1